MRGIFVTVTLVLATTASAGPGYWTGSGPSGGSVYTVLVDPLTPTAIHAATRGGIFRSFDDGATWERAENGIPPGALYTYLLARDGDAPGTLWTADSEGRVLRTTDGADNWALTGAVVAYTPAGSTDSQSAILAIVDAPGVAGTVYLATANLGVLRSTDNGSTFIPINTGLPTGAPIATLDVDPGSPLLMIAGTGSYDPAPLPVPQPSLYRSTNGGATWSPVLSVPGAGFQYAAYDASFGAGMRVYALLETELYASNDDGATWAPRSLFGDRVQAHPTLPDTLFLLQQLTFNGSPGLVRSTDGGTSSVPLAIGLAPNATYSGSAGVQTLALHPAYPATPRIWVGSTDAGLYRSNDDGATFAASFAGMLATNIRALAVHPNPSFSGPANRRIYAGYGDAFSPSPALYRSSDGGTTWATLNNNLRGYQIRTITIDPTTAGTTPPALATTHVYAAGRSDSSSNSALRNGSIYKSTDGGLNWTTIDAGLPLSGTPPTAHLRTVRSLVLDPRSCASPPASGPCTSGPLQTVLATATGFVTQVVGGDGVRRQFFTHRIVRSSNAGASWAASDSGLPPELHGPPQGVPPNQFALLQQQVTPVPMALNATNPNRIYIGTFASLFDAVAPTIRNGVFRSDDGGATWMFKSDGLPRRTGSTDTAYDVLSLAIHPTNPDIAWVSVIDLDVPNSGSVYKTINGGDNWFASASGITAQIDIRALVVDPGDPNVLYATGAGSASNPGAVYKSTDGGASWLSISIGLPADAALALAVDPFNASLIHAGTNSGAWQLEQVPDADADGAPDQIEGNAPNGGDGNADGTADATQSDVGSSIVQFFAAAPARGVAGSFTTDIVPPVTGDCSQAVDVQGVVAARNGRDYLPNSAFYYAYPQDLVRFEILDCTRATVDITFHAPGLDFSTYGWSMRYYGPSVPGDDSTVGWHDFGARAIRTGTRTWRLTLDAGQFGSYRPLDSGSILWVGGPAFLDDRILRDGFENP